jgi:hypothetical protein
MYGRKLERRMAEGLVRADRALRGIPAAVVSYEALIAGESALQDALRRLYPEASVSQVRYLDGAFLAQRERIAARRSGARYARLRGFVEECRAASDADESRPDFAAQQGLASAGTAHPSS